MATATENTTTTAEQESIFAAATMDLAAILAELGIGGEDE